MAPRFVERRRTPSETKLIHPDAKPRRILLVEDNLDIREMIATALQGQGYQVDHAALPEEGIDQLRKGRYDLVVAHYNLPGKTAAVMLNGIPRTHSASTPPVTASGMLTTTASA